MLKAELQDRVNELEAELAALKAAEEREEVIEATVMFGIRNLETGAVNWMGRDNMTREEAEHFAAAHAAKIGRRFEVTFYPKQGTERVRG